MDGIIVLLTQSPAHHAGGSHAKEIVYGVKGQQYGSCQSHCRVLNRIV